MSILNSIKTQTVTAASSYGLKKVISVLRNSLGLGDKEKIGGPLSKSSANYNKPTNILSFPLDVTSGPGLGNQGHYVMFYINEQESAELRYGKRKQSGNKNMAKAKAEANIPDYITRDFGSHTQLVRNDQAIAQQLNENVNQGNFLERRKDEPVNFAGSTAYVERAPTVRLDTAIALYMPPTAIFDTIINYQDTQIGAGAALATDVYADIVAGKKSGSAIVSSALDQLGPAVSEGLLKLFLAGAGAIPGLEGVKEAYEMKTGVVIADRMELAFKGINKRKFQFQFKFIPKNKKEADEVRKIIFAFRSNAVPEFVGGNRAGRKMRVPNTFDISYMYDGNDNQYLQKISTCVLENVNVSYGGDRYRTFTPNEEGAPPVETAITLNFGEMELITKERVYEGY